MNLDSIHRFIAEARIFQMQQSSEKSPCDSAVAASPRETCHSCLPRYGLQTHATQNVCAHSHSTREWDISEELRLRELEEVKARAAQMEKTMRWWSDCTANWREKWSQVRAERNSAREEGRQLRIKLEMTMKELSALKKKQRLPCEKEAIEVQVTQDLKPPCFLEATAQEEQFQAGLQTREGLVENQSSSKANTNSKEEDMIKDSLRLNENMKVNVDFSDLFNSGGSGNSAVKPGLRLRTVNLPLESEVPEMSALQGPSDEFKNILWKEREVRSSLEKEIERLESALSLWKWKYEELRGLKLKNTKEINLFHDQHESEVEVVSGDIKEEPKSQNSKDQEIPQLRTKELLELQHAHCKLNKQYQSTKAKLAHANSQVDQNEAEIKKLRFQVEELKRGLNQKEEELDDSMNQIHKLQRSLDEQKEINENLEIELRHLESRIEKQQGSLFKVKYQEYLWRFHDNRK